MGSEGAKSKAKRGEKMDNKQQLVIEILKIFADSNLSIRECKEVLEAVKEALEDLIPWGKANHQ